MLLLFKNKQLISFFFLLFFTISYSQNDVVNESNNESVKRRVSDYPEGFYYSYKDFITKKVRPSLNIERRNLGYEKIENKDTIVDQIFFYVIRDTTKLTDIFAVSHQGNLYIQQRYLTSYAKKGNKGETGDNPNSYHRVIKDGKFLYLEGYFGNALSKAFAMNAGVGGYYLSKNINRLKGVIFNFEDNKFDFFKNCEDFSTFMTEQNFLEEINCKNKSYSISIVREIIDKMNQ